MVQQMISRNLFLFSIKGEEFIAFKETRRHGMESGSLARVALGSLWAPSFLISKMGLIFLLRMVIAWIKRNVECESILPIAHNP